MIRKIVLITLILTLVLAGCQKAQEPVKEQETTEISIESEISEIDSLDEDLNLEELENIEAELDEINW